MWQQVVPVSINSVFGIENTNIFRGEIRIESIEFDFESVPP